MLNYQFIIKKNALSAHVWCHSKGLKCSTVWKCQRAAGPEGRKRRTFALMSAFTSYLCLLSQLLECI